MDEQFESYEDCLKYNAVLDMKEAFKLYELGVNKLETPKKGSR